MNTPTNRDAADVPLPCPFCGDQMEQVNGGDSNPRLVRHPMQPLDGAHCIIAHLHFPVGYLELWNRRASLVQS